MSIETQFQLPGGSLATPQMNLDKYVITQNEFARAGALGRLYSATHQGTGIITQAGLSATDAILTLYNPLGSGVTGKLWYANFLMKVANTAAAVVWLAAGTVGQAAEVTGTAAVCRNWKLGGGASNNQGQTLQALTTATLPAAPVAICTLGVGLTGAITTIPFLAPLERWFHGAFLVQPGTSISFQTSTASGAASCHAEVCWEEVPLIS